MRTMKRAATTLFLLVSLLWAGSAFGHAEAPLSRRAFVFADGTWMLRTNFGAISSDRPNEFICEEAFLGGDRFQIAATGATSFVTFGETTIQRTEDGCEFERVAALEARAEDVDAHAESQSVAYVTNGDTEFGLFVSTDAGKTFRPVGELDGTIYQFTTVRFLDATSVVVGAYERDADGKAAILAVDLTDGTVTPLELPEGITFPYVIAAGGGRFLFNAREMVQTLYIGTLENPTLHTRPLNTGELWPTGAGFAPDGSALWMTGLVIGLGVEYAEWNDTELSWQSAMSSSPAQCVASNGEDVFVCSSVAGGGEADFVTLAGDVQSPVLTFDSIVGPRECPAESDVGTVCPLVWPEIAPALGVEVEGSETPDAGATSPDAGETAEPIDPVDQDESCAVGSGTATPLGLLLVALFARRRRTTRLRRSAA